MKVVICGAGQVGFGIAEKLAAEENDVAIIDSSSRRLAAVSEMLDVRTIEGHGAHPDILEKSGADQADMLIAVTLHDEINMVICQVAHSLFTVPKKIARIRAQNYLAPQWSGLYARDHLPIDVIISPEIEVGEAVIRRLALPGAVEVRRFLDDQVAAIGVECGANCPIIDTPLRNLTELFPDLDAIIVGIARDNILKTPTSSDVVKTGDIAYIVMPADKVARTLALFGHEEATASRIVIAGGGNVGLYVAQKLAMHTGKTDVTIIENSHERAELIAEKLDDAIVVGGNSLDQSILEEAGISGADTLVAVTNEDEVNVLSCVMARQLGCGRNLALLNDRKYVTFASALGIDGYVNPRAVTISRILQHVRRGRIRSVYSLHDGAAEIIEAVALETSPLLHKPLRDIDLPTGMRIGAIFRDNAIVQPSGEFEILPDDRLVLFALADKVRQAEQMFRVSLEYF